MSPRSNLTFGLLVMAVGFMKVMKFVVLSWLNYLPQFWFLMTTVITGWQRLPKRGGLRLMTRLLSFVI